MKRESKTLKFFKENIETLERMEAEGKLSKRKIEILRDMGIDI